MATYYARASGNINAAIWATTPTGTAASFYPFDPADILVANGFGVTINVNVTVAQIRNDSTGGSSGLGSFGLANGVTVTANIFAGSVASTPACVTVSASNSATIIGNITGGGTGGNVTFPFGGNGLAVTTTGIVTVTGNVTGGSNFNCTGIVMTSGNVTVNGNLVGGTNTTAHGAHVAGGTLTVNGFIQAGFPAASYGINIVGGNLVVTVGPVLGTGTARAIDYSTTGTGVITANVFGSNGIAVHALNYNSSAGTLTINGNVLGGSANTGSAGIICTSTGNLVINGNVTGLFGPGVINAAATTTITGTVTGGSSAGITNTTGTVTINGTAVGGSGSPGASNTSTGQMTVTRAKGNAFGAGNPGVTAQPGVSNSSTGVCIVSELEYGDLGQSPTAGVITFPNSTANRAIVYKGGGIKKTLIDAATSATLVPTNGNVRNGVSYNLGNNTGTCVIPAANTVVAGTPVDATVGTAVLSVATILDELTSNTRVAGSFGERLRHVATTATTAQQLADMV